METIEEITWSEGNRPNVPEGEIWPFLIMVQNPGTGEKQMSCAWYANMYRFEPSSYQGNDEFSCMEHAEPDYDFDDEIVVKGWMTSFCNHCETRWPWSGGIIESFAGQHQESDSHD